MVTIQDFGNTSNEEGDEIKDELIEKIEILEEAIEKA